MKTIPRVVVTGEKDGKSVIIKDEITTNTSEHFPGLIISDIWATDAMPAGQEQTTIENTAFPNTPANGTYFRYVQIPPDTELGVKAEPGKQHPLMHKTQTLDYIIILAGELYLIMEEGETLLKPGDIVIQRGTNHAWSNRGTTPCIQLAVLIDAQS